MAQVKTVIINPVFKTTKDYTLSGSLSATSGPNQTGYLLAPPVKNDWIVSQTYSLRVQQDQKTLISITDQKQDSTYHVWIDKRSITWTSDSTFVLKRKL